MPDIEETIRRALEEGKFDNLTGKGKPLDLDDDAHVDPEWRTAYRMLKGAGYSLPWIELRREIEAEITAARAALRRAHKFRREQADPAGGAAMADAEWQRARGAFVEWIPVINNRIRDYNLQTPSEKFQMRLLNIERELEQARR